MPIDSNAFVLIGTDEREKLLHFDVTTMPSAAHSTKLNQTPPSSTIRSSMSSSGPMAMGTPELPVQLPAQRGDGLHYDGMMTEATVGE